MKAPEQENPITIHDLALFRLRKLADTTFSDAAPSMTAEDFHRVNLAVIGGCQDCGATIAAYDAHPSRSGFWKCGDCIGEDGYPTVQWAEHAILAGYNAR